MGIVDTITSAFEASTNRAPDEGGDDGSKGSFWCDDCGNRVRDVEVEREGLETDGEGTPFCPDCGDEMRFERATGSSCAC
ncbi:MULTISPECIES: hypothetical protein [unclassified Haloparvum]|uniref:hypothetical protein n=1 Tax=Haloparvum sp. PAK95 TaxID=3418962 RepID=UPI003D2EEEAB